MRVDTRDLMSVTDANNKGLSWVVNEASCGRNVVILKNNRAEAMVVGMDQAERLEHLDDLAEELRVLAIALVRLVTDDGVRHSLDDVVAELGIDEADDDDAGNED